MSADPFRKLVTGHVSILDPMAIFWKLRVMMIVKAHVTMGKDSRKAAVARAKSSAYAQEIVVRTTDGTAQEGWQMPTAIEKRGQRPW